MTPQFLFADLSYWYLSTYLEFAFIITFASPSSFTSTQPNPPGN